MAGNDNIRCVVCGRVPTRRITIRRHVGMVIVARFFRLDKSLCRDHGVSMTKAYLRKTMVQGWWGVISIFVNAFDVIWDLRALAAYKRVPAPPVFTERHQMRRFDGSALPKPF